MSKRILFLSFYFSPDLRPCSFRADSVLKALNDELDLRGDDVEIDVITNQPARYDTEITMPDYYTKVGRVNIYRITLSNNKDGFINEAKLFLSYIYQASKIIRKKKYNLVFATTARLMTAFFAAMVAKKNNSKLYVDVRDNFVSNIKELFNRPLALCFCLIFSIIERLVVNRADIVNLNSKGFKHYFLDRYPNQTFSFYTNGLDTDFFSAAFDTYSSPSDVIKVLYAGNLGRAQALDLILPELANKLNELVSFTIIGAGRSSELLRLAASDLNLTNLELLPVVSRSKLNEYYAEADVLFLHLDSKDSLKQVLPSKLFEYAASGKPIMAGVDGYAKEFIQAEIKNAVVFKPCDVDDATKAFSQLKYKYTDRSHFIEKFTRSEISKSMAKDILSCLD